jgi:hypothetical protein
MKTLRLLLWLSFFAFAPLALAADAALGDRLVGVWREYSPSSNIVRFDKDGTATLYLKKGEIGNLRTLDGKWSVDESGMLSVVYTVQGRSMTLQARLSYEGEEMVLTEAGGERTKHRRHTGPIPEIYVW